MKRLDLVLAWSLVVLGFVHCGTTVAGFHGMAADRIWYLISGVAIVECGFLNMARASGGRGTVHVGSTISNVFLFLAFIGLSIVALTNGHFFRSTMLILNLLLIGGETLFSIAS